MTDLIVCMTDNTGISHIKALIEKNEWSNVFVLTTEDIATKFEADAELYMIVLNLNQTTESLVNDIFNNLRGQLKRMDVALNLFSGKGKEHMAILSALIKLGVGIRLVKQGKEKVEEI